MYKLSGIILMLVYSCLNLVAQDVTTITAKNSDISDNLNLEAVASVFGDSKDLEDFEKRLNDPSTKLSNLDLNNDGIVDYLRVVELVDQTVHLITIQAVIGEDLYQDVATIEVEKDSDGQTQVQIVGDVYFYGPNYIIEPFYYRTPFIYTVFWSPSYSLWYSPYYWDYYPSYYYTWSPFPIYIYVKNVSVYIGPRNSYSYVGIRKSHTAQEMYSIHRKNDYEVQHPDNSFVKRNVTVKNKLELDQNRGIIKVNQPKNNEGEMQPRPTPNTVPKTSPQVKPESKPQVSPQTKPNVTPKPKVTPQPNVTPKPSVQPKTPATPRPRSVPKSSKSNTKQKVTPRKSNSR
ncbi:MAG: hypothetical protein R2753_09855 [Chitinophagales bacterium]